MNRTFIDLDITVSVNNAKEETLQKINELTIGGIVLLDMKGNPIEGIDFHGCFVDHVDEYEN